MSVSLRRTQEGGHMQVIMRTIIELITEMLQERKRCEAASRMVVVQYTRNATDELTFNIFPVSIQTFIKPTYS